MGPKQVIRHMAPRGLRNWLRSPSRSATWLWDSLQFSFGNARVLEIIPGWNLKCHPYAYKIYQRDQVFDPEQSREFRNFQSTCIKDMLLFDVGAHFGIFSLAAAHAGGKAVAIDPSPQAIRMIEKQKNLNGYSSRIETLTKAVSCGAGTMDLLGSGVFSDGYFKVSNTESKSELTSVPTILIDEATNRFGVPTHIKVDVEGHEASVLRSATETLTRHSPLLFLELHNQIVASDGGDPRAALDELSRMDYEMLDLNGQSVDQSTVLRSPLVRIVAHSKMHRHDNGRALKPGQSLIAF